MIHKISKLGTANLLLGTGAILAATMLTSAGILYLFEHGRQGANILDFNDALWWSFATITTVGYGDHYPVTLGGRITAIVLMFTGITLFLTFTGIISAYVMRAENKLNVRKEKQILQRIDKLEELLTKTERLVEKVNKEVA